MKLVRHLAIIAGAIGVQPAYAATFDTSFSDWIATVSNPYITDFNDVTDDLSFNASPSSYRDLTFSVSAPGFNSDGNRIDAPAFALDGSGFYTKDGTSYLAIDLVPNSIFSIRFDRGENVFGATFAGLANGSRLETIRLYDEFDVELDRISFEDRPNFIDPPTDAMPEEIFLGVTSSVQFNKITVTYTPKRNATTPVNDFFGLDNIWRSQAAAAVPEPTSWAFMICGFGLMGAVIRRQRRTSIFVKRAAGSQLQSA